MAPVRCTATDAGRQCLLVEGHASEHCAAFVPGKKGWHWFGMPTEGPQPPPPDPPKLDAETLEGLASALAEPGALEVSFGKECPSAAVLGLLSYSHDLVRLARLGLAADGHPRPAAIASLRFAYDGAYEEVRLAYIRRDESENEDEMHDAGLRRVYNLGGVMAEALDAPAVTPAIADGTSQPWTPPADGTLDSAELARHYAKGRAMADRDGDGGCYADDGRHRSGLRNVYVEARKAAFRALLRQHGEGVETLEAERGKLEEEAEKLRAERDEARLQLQREQEQGEQARKERNAALQREGKALRERDEALKKMAEQRAFFDDCTRADKAMGRELIEQRDEARRERDEAKSARDEALDRLEEEASHRLEIDGWRVEEKKRADAAERLLREAVEGQHTDITRSQQDAMREATLALLESPSVEVGGSLADLARSVVDGEAKHRKRAEAAEKALAKAHKAMAKVIDERDDALAAGQSEATLVASKRASDDRENGLRLQLAAMRAERDAACDALGIDRGANAVDFGREIDAKLTSLRLARREGQKAEQDRDLARAACMAERAARSAMVPSVTALHQVAQALGLPIGQDLTHPTSGVVARAKKLVTDESFYREKHAEWTRGFVAIMQAAMCSGLPLPTDEEEAAGRTITEFVGEIARGYRRAHLSLVMLQNEREVRLVEPRGHYIEAFEKADSFSKIVFRSLRALGLPKGVPAQLPGACKATIEQAEGRFASLLSKVVALQAALSSAHKRRREAEQSLVIQRYIAECLDKRLEAALNAEHAIADRADGLEASLEHTRQNMTLVRDELVRIERDRPTMTTNGPDGAEGSEER